MKKHDCEHVHLSPNVTGLLKGSHDVISSFSFSLECYKLFIDKIPEVTKTKVSNPERYSLSKLRHAPLKHLD